MVGLTAVLSADISSFEGAMLAATKIATNFAKSFASTMNHSIESVAKQFKESGNFDISLTEFQKLNFAAEQTETSFNLLQVAARRLQKNIGEAVMGGRPQIREAFKTLGIDAKELAAKPLMEQFEMVSKAMDKIHNTTIANTLAMRLYGVAGVRESQFHKELAAQREKFDRLISPQSELDGSKIYGAYQALREVHSILGNIYDQIAAKIAPVITNIVQKFEQWGFTGVDLKAKIDSAFESLQNFAAYGLAAGRMMFDVFGTAFEFIKTNFDSIAKIMETLIPGMAGISLIIKNIGKANTDAFINMLPPGIRENAQLQMKLGGEMFKVLGPAIYSQFKGYLALAKDDIKNLTEGGALREAMDRLPRGRPQDMDLNSLTKTNPIGYALQITSAANIPSMQLAAKEVQEVHDPGVAKEIRDVGAAIREAYHQQMIGAFGP